MSEEGLSKRNRAKTLFNICPFLNRDLTFSQLKSVRGSHAVITKQMLQFPSVAARKVTWIRASLIHEIKDKTCIDVSISGMGKRRKIKSSVGSAACGLFYQWKGPSGLHLSAKDNVLCCECC